MYMYIVYITCRLPPDLTPGEAGDIPVHHILLSCLVLVPGILGSGTLPPFVPRGLCCSALLPWLLRSVLVVVLRVEPGRQMDRQTDRQTHRQTGTM